MENSIEFNRTCWASRRGMLELDLVLEPFVKEVYPSLSDRDQERYRKLLECEDQELFGWFLGRVRPEDADIAHIVDAILAFARQPG